jgi:hypothetical protein
MDKTTTNLKLLGAIKKHLDTLEDAFYDGIPNELLQNNHITEFTHIMELIHSKIITLVKNSILESNKDMQHQDISESSNIDNNYSQLAALGDRIRNT